MGDFSSTDSDFTCEYEPSVKKIKKHINKRSKGKIKGKKNLDFKRLLNGLKGMQNNCIICHSVYLYYHLKFNRKTGRQR